MPYVIIYLPLAKVNQSLKRVIVNTTLQCLHGRKYVASNVPGLRNTAHVQATDASCKLHPSVS